MIILPSITNGSIGGSYESFPYLPRSIRDNNSFADDFINLPEIGGIPKWTENAPPGWLQSSPYYDVFLKWYLKADESDENVADGGGRVHALKAAGIGSSLGLNKARMITRNPIANGVEDDKDWSLYRIQETVTITTQTYVNFGCFYKVLEQDLLRSLNFGGIAVFFTKGSRSSYLNYSVVHGAGVDLFGNSSYQYLNTYDASKIYEAYNQWLGQPIIKLKKLDQINMRQAGQPRTSLLNQWQFLNYQVEIPIFNDNPLNPERDGETGKADICTMMIFFGENNSYLDDGSGLNTGAVQFLRPFLSLS